MRRRATGLLAASCLGVCLLLFGCDDGVAEPLACVTDLPAVDCAPLYTPIYDQVFSQTLAPKCAVAGGACHAASGARGGLILEDADDAYAHLLDPPSGPPRVIPADPGCSPMVQRLFADATDGLMPPGSPLSAEERCAVVTWIRDGALR